MTITAPESIAVRLRQQLQAAHAVPQFDLVSIPWIPVVDHAGNTRQVGIDELLGHAHEIRDLAEPDPIVRAALRRFGEALAAQIVRLAGAKRDSWLERAEVGSSFNVHEVDALVADSREHLWLYHPWSPFLQDIRLIDALTKPELLSTDELTAHLPGRGEAAWFVKPGDPASGAGLEPAAAARGLVARWFYCLPGNSAEVRTPNGNNGAQCGGVFSEGKATATHAFRVSRLNLATTLLRNLTLEMVTNGAPVPLAGPAWSHPDRS
ncbi:MAG: type I-E CRISPR-associated protein Cse1/CasA, partial [Acidimicrobiales bacterium]